MKIHPINWYTNRQLTLCPKHFIRCRAEVTTEAKFWVYENLIGRFYIGSDERNLFDPDIIYFEDPQEAMMFELRWS
jgi:hypothetical protein